MKAVGLILMILFAACSPADSQQKVDPGNEVDLTPTDLNRVRKGVPAPDFTLESENNQQITLSSYRGKKNVVLVFYRGYW